MVASVSRAGKNARPILLDVARPLDVLAVVSPVLARAESLRAELPVKDAGHLDAVLRLEDVRAVGEVAVDDDEAGVPELGAGEVLRAVALVAADLRVGDAEAADGEDESAEGLEEHFVLCCSLD